MKIALTVQVVISRTGLHILISIFFCNCFLGWGKILSGFELVDRGEHCAGVLIYEVNERWCRCLTSSRCWDINKRSSVLNADKTNADIDANALSNQLKTCKLSTVTRPSLVHLFGFINPNMIVIIIFIFFENLLLAYAFRKTPSIYFCVTHVLLAIKFAPTFHPPKNCIITIVSSILFVASRPVLHLISFCWSYVHLHQQQLYILFQNNQD